MLNDLAKEIVLITGFAKTPVLLTIYNLIGILVIRAFYDTIIYFNNKVIKDEKRLYVLNKKMQVVKIALYFIVTIIIWKTQIKSVMTLISLIGAAITIALKDIIANFFAGIYISIYKPFKVEDRIEIDGSTGDVVNINTLYFELLEVSSKEVGEQSTGIIVQIPNFMIFTKC